MSRYVKDTNGNWNLSAGIPQIDNELDITSENPVQNKAIVEGISPIVNVLGAKNLLPNNATSQTIANVQFTVNLDGSVVADGTASDSANAVLALSSNVPVKKGRYLLTGCPSGGGIDKYILSISGIGSDKGDGYELNLTEDTTLTFNIIIYKSITVSNITFKPMLRPASIPDDTYVPYAMTNRELSLCAIKSGVLTLTTSALGNAVSTIEASNIWCIAAQAVDRIVTPWISSSNYWAFKVLNPDGTAYANQSVVFRYFYIPVPVNT